MLLFEIEASGTGHKRYYLPKVTKIKQNKIKNPQKTKQNKKTPRYNVTIYGRNFLISLLEVR